MPLQQVTIPLGEGSPCFIRTLQEGEQCFFGRGFAAYIIVEINEFTQGSVVAGLCRLDGCCVKALGRGSGVAVESGFAEAPISRPEPCTDHLARISLARHCVRAFAWRSGSTGKSRDREIEATPEEVDRADF